MQKLIKITALLLLALIVLTGCNNRKDSDMADLLFTNGNVVTMDDSIPSAQAIAVKGDKIIFVGSNEDAEDFIGDSTAVIDLKGGFVMPGFFESHAHFLGVGRSKIDLNLTSAKNWDEVIAMVAKAVELSVPGEWIIGRGWHQEKFDPPPFPAVEGFPIHKFLSDASPENPVILKHASGHAIFANAYAMRMANIDSYTTDPPGGRIIKDSLGLPVGVFQEEAEKLITDLYQKHIDGLSPKEQNEKINREIKFATDECLSKGITSFYDAGSTFDEIDVFMRLADENKLRLRLNLMIDEEIVILKKRIKDYKLIGYGNNFLTVRAVKKYIDGALGSRGAWMLDPYSDMTDQYGENVTTIDELIETAEIAVQNGFQMCTHAIGDRGNREILNVYEFTFDKYPNLKDLRWRVEHAQHLTEKDIPRFGKLGVLAAMQGVHCTSDGPFVIKRIGEDRAKEGAYVWRKLLDSGAIICNGTDSPVEDVNPIECFYSAVTRKMNNGKQFYPDQKMTRKEALKSYTINGAYGAFQENLLGSITVGKLADFTVLSNDLLNCPEDQIRKTKVLYTIVGGEIKYKSSNK